MEKSGERRRTCSAVLQANLTVCTTTITTFAPKMENPPKTPADSLITALKERNISVKRGEIETALNDATSKAENTQWIAEHLSYDTLLTREELELYDSLSLFCIDLCGLTLSCDKKILELGKVRHLAAYPP